MASPTSKRKSVRVPAAKRARTLERGAVKAADRLTLQVLQGGLMVNPTGAPARSKKQRRGAGISARASAPDTAPAVEAFARAAVQVAPIGLKADVTPKLLAAAPAFGDVLRSIGHAVALTQIALDETALESLKTLAAQPVDVPVLVEQTLNDDGTPKSVQIITAKMPLTSIITPSMQQVDQMTLRMDMRVQSFDATSGIKFNQNMASAGVSYNMHSFGFAVAVNNTNINAQFSNMSDFSSGSVMMSLDIVDRTGFQIPKPLEYGIGANVLVRLISIDQAATVAPDPPGVERVAIFSVKLVKTNGSVVSNFSDYEPTVPPGLLVDSSTAGQMKIKRMLVTGAEPYLERKVYVKFGDLTKEATLYI